MEDSITKLQVVFYKFGEKIHYFNLLILEVIVFLKRL